VRLLSPKLPSLKLPANPLNPREWLDLLRLLDEALFGRSTQQVRKLPILLIAGLIISLVSLCEVFDVPFFHSFSRTLEDLTFDLRVGFSHRQSAANPNIATNLALVEITDDTITMVNKGTLGYRYGLYWPRTVYAEALQELTQRGAAAVGFDVLFDTRRPDDPNPIAADHTTLGADAYFADVIKNSGITLLGTEHGVTPDTLFQQGAVDLGNVGTDFDDDGVLRKDRPYVVYRVWDPFVTQIALSLGLELDKTTVEFSTCEFAADDITDLPALAGELKTPTNEVSRYVLERLDSATQAALASFQGTVAESNNLQKLLVKGLNQIVAGPSIYGDTRYAGVKLRPEVFRLLEATGKDGGVARLNRVLLEDAYPLELARNEAARITFVRKHASATNFIAEEGFHAPAVAALLTNPPGPLAKYLASQMDATAKAAIAEYQKGGTNLDELETSLVKNFNRLIAGPSLYDPERFQSVVLRAETDKLLQKNPTGEELTQLNRMLLEDAFPTALTIFLDRDRDGFTQTKSFTSEVPANQTQFIPFAYRMVWSMGIALAAQSELKLDLDKSEIQPDRHRVILHGDKGLTRVIPLEPDGTYYIDWEFNITDPGLQHRRPDTTSLLQFGSLDELLQEHKNRADGKPTTNDWWKNRLVMIGSAATGLKDTGPTPLDGSTVLVAKHLNVANAIMLDRFITTCPEWLTLALIVLMGGFAAWTTAAVTRSLIGSLAILTVTVIYITLACWLYNQFRFWLPVIMPMFISGLLTHAAALTYRVQAEQALKKQMKSVFAKMLAPQVVEELLQLGKLETRVRREITVYFADVRGFTTLTDKTQTQAAEYIAKHNLSPVEAEAYYNQVAKNTLDTVSTYLATIAGAIKKHNGTLDKYIGDCAMAFWGGPLQNPHHARDAVLSAIDAQRAMLALNLQRHAENKRIEAEAAGRAAQGLPPETPLPLLSMGTGINTGQAIMGLMGSEEHGLNYTVFGREVNLASRLEGLSGYGRIIISHTTFLALQRDAPDLAAACVEQIPENLKGFREAVKNYEVRWRPEGGPEDPTLTQSPLVYGTGTSTFIR
jgi:class 3 adenylate cyclase/CHASE2 domain-containing sensor protein